jgi:adenylylsulfate kinase-like enzyme
LNINNQIGGEKMLSKYEMETIMIFSEEEDTAIVSTLSKKVANRLIKVGYQPEILDVDSYRFVIAKKDLRFLDTDKKIKKFTASK